MGRRQCPQERQTWRDRIGSGAGVFQSAAVDAGRCKAQSGRAALSRPGDDPHGAKAAHHVYRARDENPGDFRARHAPEGAKHL